MGKTYENTIVNLVESLSYGQTYNTEMVDYINEVGLCNDYPINFEKLQNIEICIKKDGTKKGEVKFVNDKYVISVSDIYGFMAQRFTTAHELAHIIFDFEDLKKGNKYESNFASNSYSNDIVEVRANRFAVELLMPSEEVHKLLIERKTLKEEQGQKYYLSELKKDCIKKFQVSEMVVENRLKNIGIIKNG